MSATSFKNPPDVKPCQQMAALFVIVQIGILLSQFWKYKYFQFAWMIYQRTALDAGFFPEFMRSSTVMGAMFVAVAVCTVGAILLPMFRVPMVWIQWLGCTGLCLHQATYNDATFTTMWWTSCWSVWAANQIRKRDLTIETLERSAFLSRVIVSMILLGGAVGKWTADYWSGQVMFDIYFVDRNFWTFNLLKGVFEVDALREIATWYSRMVVVTETVFGFSLWLMPTRIAAIAGMVLLTSIALFSNFLLFSVMACLIALMSAGLFVPPSRLAISNAAAG